MVELKLRSVIFKSTRGVSVSKVGPDPFATKAMIFTVSPV